ncbi:MAG: sigma 54-interacting transcriptional regulator [Clostridia bacterium]|nr:sigma 54-interacting transcriptional regulator [Clostridia bacterium]
MAREVVSTILERCKQCYSCVRNCPTKAVKIENGQARVMQDRCIYCGNCVKMCSQDAKKILNSKLSVKKILRSDSKVFAIVAPSFPVQFHNKKDLIYRLKKMGFWQVWEVAVGAELVAQEYERLDYQNNRYISSTCPAIVNLIQKHYPHLIKYLAPVLSPAQATAKLIRLTVNSDDIKIVFIGPCVAKKWEAEEEGYKGLIDEVLTFEECEELFLEYATNDKENIPDQVFDGPAASLGYLFPVSGGLLKNINVYNDILSEEHEIVEGIKPCIELLECFEKTPYIKLADCLFCSGCISGPKVKDDSSLLERKGQILDYMRSIPLGEQVKGKLYIMELHIDLDREFADMHKQLAIPSEKEINEILRETGKQDIKDQLNCGACGYSSCREKAIAVYQGIAENQMCLPYLLSQKNYLLKSLEQRLDAEKRLTEELKGTINSSFDGICVTDGNGKILKINDAFEKMMDRGKDEIVGKNVKFLEEAKILYPSIGLIILRSKKPVTLIQSIRNQKEVLATGNPVFDSNGVLYRVIINIRDYEEIEQFRKQYDSIINNKNKKITSYLDTMRIISHSREFTSTLELARRVAKVDSTVLILGESGAGKEVVANFIYNLSDRKDKPFIKVNCASLPSSLIESELFGYETGAFTGAHRHGKPGMFELADKGIIFLDEIGELPLSQQVKLLRVIQEGAVMRIGGVSPIDIDVRIIAATNSDPGEMVKEGRFRADLYYRLNVVPITIPPLRERRDDIIPLMYFFLDVFNKKYRMNKTISKGVKQKFLEYEWPGNVRELRNIIERVVVTSKTNIISLYDLQSCFDSSAEYSEQKVRVNGIIPLRKALQEVEKQLLTQARSLYKTTYKIAEALEINQSTVVRKMQKYSMDQDKGE